MQVRHPVFSTKTFGVCIDSPLFGDLRAKTIIQNIEINKVLGAEWFTFYIYKADQTLLQVLSTGCIKKLSISKIALNLANRLRLCSFSLREKIMKVLPSHSS